MPKISKKQKFLQIYERIMMFDLLALDTFDGEEQEEDDLLEEWSLLLIIAENVRYFSPFVHHSIPKSQQFLNKVLPFHSEDRFKQFVRVSWPSFKFILNLIKDSEVFNGVRSCQQLPVEVQLIITMYRLGSSGEGATVAKIASLFGISDGGTLQIITERVFTAILKLKNKFVFWPSAEERTQLVAETMHELPHCIGYLDGTEIKLAEKPSQDPEAYFSRKHIYSVKVQAVCDHKLRLRHLALSWPGSVHDSRMFKTCSLGKKPEEFFSGYEWLAGDKAYTLSRTIITPFRGNSSVGTIQQRNSFNATFSKYRIRIEHTFGRLKERFSSLKELKLKVASERDIKRINRWVLVCAILHNILIHIDDCDDFNTDDHDVDPTEEEISTEAIAAEGEVKRNAIFQLMFP